MPDGIGVKIGGIVKQPFSEKKHESEHSANSGAPVGLFDSGVGGLTVLKEVIKQLPHEEVVYFGDTARVPYGGKSSDEIIKIDRDNINLLLRHNVKMIVMACGTSSAFGLRRMQDEFGKIPILGVIDPGAITALSVTKNLKIGIIATEGTVASGAYDAAIKSREEKAEVFSAACPLFVPLIEGDFINADETKKTAKGYLQELIKAGVDTLVLGCTHYPHIKHIIAEIMGPAVTIIDPAEATAAETKLILKKFKLINPSVKMPHYQFIVSDSPAKFVETGGRLLGRQIINIAKETA